GNICRSPIAERIFRKEMPRKIIDSAGTGALVGHPADDAAIRIAQANDISLADHSGQQFTPSMARKYDLLLVMEKSHIEAVTRIAPEARGKTLLLGQWLGGKEIPDPYRKSDEAFFSVYKLI
ncbi:TPA: low molecular weight phosphotyrosine protein phosphatase, partial [Klebsiella pneumoniae]|nr:low molecular weight phosphotyrosine protein phosphatase [Klebsiella pneumoniae]